jgi:hypothetical protein
MSMFYMDILKMIDDSISLCMYFGLVCNGTWIYLQHGIVYTSKQNLQRTGVLKNKNNESLSPIGVFSF